MNPFLQQLKNLGPARLAAMGGVAVGLVGFIIFFATRFATPPMELLYGNLNASDSREIVNVLERSSIPFQVNSDSTEIMVPVDQVTDVRLQIAEQGLPSGGSVGYEVFDDMDSLGSTNFIQNVTLVRALEGELARTVRSIENVQNARVHLVMPQREMFSREMQEPSASVFLKMKSGRLTAGQTQAVQHIIAAAVPRLRPNNISIIDERGTLLSRMMDPEDGSMIAAQQEEKVRDYEGQVRTAIEDMLERSLGPGRVRAEVRAEMDFDRVVTNEEIFDPDGAVPASTQTREETSELLETEPQNVSVANQLPGAGLNNDGGPRAQSSETVTEETVNFEISKRTVNQIRETGVVRRLSVAVLVDGTYEENAEGEQTYVPLAEDTLDNVDRLVRSAMGYQADRGDQVEIINMPFVDFDEFADLEPEFDFFGFSKDEVMRMAEGLGVAVVAVLVILLVVRPLVTRAFESMPSGEDGLLTADAAAGGVAQLTGPGAAPMPLPDEEEEEEIEELIDIDKVEGRVKASSLRKIGDIVEKHPEECMGIIRSWLYQDQ